MRNFISNKTLDPSPRMDMGMTENSQQIELADINSNRLDQIPEIPQHDERSMESQLATSSKKAEEEQEQNGKENPDSHRKKIYFTFIFLFVMNFIRVFDNGILPAMATTLKEEQ